VQNTYIEQQSDCYASSTAFEGQTIRLLKTRYRDFGYHKAGIFFIGHTTISFTGKDLYHEANYLLSYFMSLYTLRRHMVEKRYISTHS